MLEHLAGRPNLHWKRTQVFLLIGFWIWRVTWGDRKGPRILWLRQFNRFLSKFTPWQIIVGTLSALYALRNADSILGLGAPEPLAHLYSADYYRATWISTALDAGFATAMPVRPKFLRDIISVLLSGYYLIYAREADEKLRRFRALCTVEMLRTTWEKTTNPYLRAITYFDRPRIPIMRQILLPRPPGSKHKKPISAWLFFSRSERELSWATDLILDFPGGGFICMGPRHHEERLRRWTIKTGKPVLALDYGKAPEYPYPWAIEEGFEAYRVLVETKGRIIGMSGRALNIVMSGDSAGANIISTVMFKIIESTNPIPRPLALVFAYPALDFNFTSWMTPSHLRVLQIEQSQSSTNVQGLTEQKDHFAKRSPLSVVKDVNERRVKRQKSWTGSLTGTLTSLTAPLSPVTKRTSSTATAEESSASSLSSSRLSKTRLNRSPPPVSISTSSASSLVKGSSKPSPLRARLLNRVSEIDNLEVNTFAPANENDHIQSHDDGAEADAESGDEEYYPLAEQDKPISARVLYPHDDLVKMQQDELSEAMAEATNKEARAKKVPIGTRLTMTSRSGFFQDRIVSPSMMRAMAILYIGPKRDPDFQTDYYISPILAPPHLLVHFPPVLMICGEKDPFVDDTVVMGGRIREAKRARKVVLRQHASSTTKLDEALRKSITPHPASILLKDLERERDRLLAEKDEDWVDIRLLEGWGHGFLQMGALLGSARNVMNEMADWIGDAFISAESAIHSGAAGSPALPVSNSSGSTKSWNNAHRRSSTSPRPPAVRSPNGGSEFVGINGSGSKPRRGSNLSPNKRTPPPPPPSVVTSASPMLASAPPSGSSPLATSSSAQIPSASLSPLPNSETETDTDTPLTFTAGKHKTPRNSFGDEEASGINGNNYNTPRRDSAMTGRQVPASSSSSSSSSSGDTVAGVEPPPLGGKAPNVLIPSEEREKWARSAVGDYPRAVPSTPTRQTTTSVLLSEAELMRRRRAEAVFGMGESIDGGLHRGLSGSSSSDSISINANGL